MGVIMVTVTVQILKIQSDVTVTGTTPLHMEDIQSAMRRIKYRMSKPLKKMSYSQALKLVRSSDNPMGYRRI